MTMKEDISDSDDLALALRALGHPVRLDILRIIAEKCKNRCCCTDVTECIPLAQSTISQHLKVLLDAGLVIRKAEGTRNCYSICTTRLTTVKNSYSEYLSALAIKTDS